MGLAKFNLGLDATGRGSVFVNGEDVSDRVVAGQVTFARNDVPRLTLRHIGEGAIEGEGIVQIESQSQTPVGDAVAEWLAELDPMQLWALSLEGGTLGEHPAPLLLKTLAEMAREQL